MAALATEGDQGGSDKLATDCRLHQNLVKKCFTVGTWNVRTLFAKGKLEQLQIEMNNYGYNILGSYMSNTLDLSRVVLTRRRIESDRDRNRNWVHGA